MKDVFRLTGIELRELVARRELSPVELVDALLARVERLDPQIRAFCHIDPEGIRQAAAASEAALRGGSVGPLHGLPVSVKDIISTKNIPTRRGSLFFKDHIPSEDAPAAERLRRAGAIIFGKTNTSEFGWKGATSNRMFPETLNPWDLSRTAGGSSGGSAAAVATGLCPLALGTDGAGSVRMPAAFCGIYGFKPSLGRIPVYPSTPVGPLSHVGPMTRTVDDAAMLFRALVGPDERDVYSLPRSDEFDRELTPAEGIKIGWSQDLGFMPVESEVRNICEAAVRKFEQAGCEIVDLDVKIDNPNETIESFFHGGIGAAVTAMPRWQEVVDPGLARVVEAATKRPIFDFGRALVARSTFCQQVSQAMKTVDLLVTPTVPTTAFSADLDGPSQVAGKEVTPIGWFGLTAVSNLTGQPAASVPAGFGSKGLPVGLQIIGRRYADWKVLMLSKTFQELTGWEKIWPDLALSQTTQADEGCN